MKTEPIAILLFIALTTYVHDVQTIICQRELRSGCARVVFVRYELNNNKRRYPVIDIIVIRYIFFYI